MRLLKISTLPATYWRGFYSKRPGLSAKDYSAQHQALMYDSAGWADFWSVALGKLGYIACEVVSNVAPLQQAWADENGIPFERNWLFEITAAQVKAFKPEVLFVNDYAIYSAAYLKRLKSECRSIRLVLGWCGAPYRDASVFEEYDIVLSSVPELVGEFLAQGHRCLHVNHAFEPRILERIDCASAAETDFAFIGSLAKKSGFHIKREALLLRLIERTPLQIWAEVGRHSWRERSGLRVRQFAYDAVEAARRSGITRVLNVPPARKVLRWKERPTLPPPVDLRLRRMAQAPIFGLEMFQKLAQSRVTLNSHIDISSCSASNMRLYEATGAGSCLLTDWKENLRDLFEPDTEVLSYRNAEDCIEKVRYLLDHEDQRQAIAAAGQRRTLRDHTFRHRAEQIVEIIEQYHSRRHARAGK